MGEKFKPIDKRNCSHEWSDWKVIAYTGDWFHPRVIQRECAKCGATETDEP